MNGVAVRVVADSENDSDSDEEEYDEDDVYRSPYTKLAYNVEKLNEDTKGLIGDLFRSPPREETPQIVLELCGITPGGDTYAFQMKEIVRRTIRIGSPNSKFPSPHCSCTESGGPEPCRHLLWLMDQITSLTVYEHNPEDELVLDEQKKC